MADGTSVTQSTLVLVTPSRMPQEHQYSSPEIQSGEILKVDLSTVNLNDVNQTNVYSILLGQWS